MVKTESISSEIRNKKGCSLLPLLLEVLVRQAEKKRNRNPDWKRKKTLDCRWQYTMPARSFCPWNSPGKNTGVGRHSLLQGLFPTQASNSGHLHCRHFFFFNLSEPPGKPNTVELASPVAQESVLTSSAGHGCTFKLENNCSIFLLMEFPPTWDAPLASLSIFNVWSQPLNLLSLGGYPKLPEAKWSSAVLQKCQHF